MPSAAKYYRIVDGVAAALAVFTIGLNQFLCGAYAGYGYAAGHICQYTYPTVKSAAGSYWISDSDPYTYINKSAICISLFLLAFVLVKLFDNKLVLRIISVALLFGALWFWHSADLILKAHLGDPDSYVDLLRDTAEFHLAVMILLGAMIALQAPLLILHPILRKGSAGVSTHT